jgi:hypothetical protein
VNPFKLLGQPDLLLLLIYNGIGFAAFYAVLSSLSTLLDEVYGLPETAIGLCFLSIAGGMMLGGVITGQILDWDYERIKRLLILRSVVSPNNDISPEDLVNDENFPIEKARLRTVPFYLVIYIVCCIGYGWAVHQKVHLAVSLLLQFVCTSSTALLSCET